MRPELQPLVRPLSLTREKPPDRDLFHGSAGGVAVVATITGIGTGRAARAAERILDAGVDHVIVVGIAGGIGPSVAIGDLVVPERVRDLDTGTEHHPVPLGDARPRGTLVTANDLITDRERIAGFEREGAIAIDMETSAIGAVCERRGCPWSVFRAISDRADDGSVDPEVFALAGPEGAGDPRAVVRFLLTHPCRIPRLVRLGRGMRAATRAAADATVRALALL